MIVKEYKLTWLNPLKPYVLNSKMFDSQVDAVMYMNVEEPSIKKQSYMLLQNTSYNNGAYVWKVLPYGEYKSYKYGMLISEFKLEILITFVIMYYIFKK